MFAATIAAPNTGPTATELNAASSLDITFYLMSEWGRPTMNTNRVQLARRLGDGAQYGTIGTTTFTGGDLQMVVNPQAAAGSDQRKAYEKFTDGLSGFIVRRLVTPLTTDWAAGQKVDLFPVLFGPSMPMPSGTGEEAEAVFQVAYEVTGPPYFDKAVSA